MSLILNEESRFDKWISMLETDPEKFSRTLASLPDSQKGYVLSSLMKKVSPETRAKLDNMITTGRFNNTMIQSPNNDELIRRGTSGIDSMIPEESRLNKTRTTMGNFDQNSVPSGSLQSVPNNISNGVEQVKSDGDMKNAFKYVARKSRLAIYKVQDGIRSAGKMVSSAAKNSFGRSATEGMPNPAGGLMNRATGGKRVALAMAGALAGAGSVVGAMSYMAAPYDEAMTAILVAIDNAKAKITKIIKTYAVPQEIAIDLMEIENNLHAATMAAKKEGAMVNQAAAITAYYTSIAEVITARRTAINLMNNSSPNEKDVRMARELVAIWEEEEAVMQTQFTKFKVKADAINQRIPHVNDAAPVKAVAAQAQNTMGDLSKNFWNYMKTPSASRNILMLLGGAGVMYGVYKLKQKWDERQAKKKKKKEKKQKEIQNEDQLNRRKSGGRKELSF